MVARLRREFRRYNNRADHERVTGELAPKKRNPLRRVFYCPVTGMALPAVRICTDRPRWSGMKAAALNDKPGLVAKVRATLNERTAN